MSFYQKKSKSKIQFSEKKKKLIFFCPKSPKTLIQTIPFYTIQTREAQTNLGIFVVGVYMTEHGQDKGGRFPCTRLWLGDEILRAERDET